ncbi:Predicted membrane protein [Ekhidna lutea]|uniref:Predicted membrane protein n=1 Tax=Ekhidna lutea TaxID=447679 RepID=A0A239H2M5_EKHLU|nr:DUF2061 domain-containing protein [Ekhidna lutea]SNS75395.1 Predicted membrane protein [Ekhidna lutea]
MMVIISRIFLLTLEKQMNSRKRHILKTLTWRVIATGTTFLLTMFFFREDPNATEKASWVALIETSFKMILYYYHERIWFSLKVEVKSAIRHLYKTLTWRVIASLTTFLVAIFIFREDPMAIEKATGIALVESLLKMLFYYLHERAWHISKFGLK